MALWSPRTDCRHYLGDRPCRFRRLCPGCADYAPRGEEALVIKLAALGDVLRTCALLPALRRCHGDDAFITWITSPAALPLVANQPEVDLALPLTFETATALSGRFFDVVYVLDKEPAATGLGLSVETGSRRGFIHDKRGALVPADDEAVYYWLLGLDDEEKFRRNQKSYQRLLAEALGLDWRGEPYRLVPDEASRSRAATIIGEVDRRRPLVGLNIGAGEVFANKSWRPERFSELIDARPDWTFLLLGGPREAEGLERLAGAANALNTGHDNPLLVFAALLEACDAVFTGDTLGLHIALAVGTPVAALFGPTCPQEIELYGLGVKLVTPLECAPCYRRVCEVSPDCLESITLEETLELLESALSTRDKPGAELGAAGGGGGPA